MFRRADVGRFLSGAVFDEDLQHRSRGYFRIDSSSAGGAAQAADVPATQPLSKTVGIDIIKKTVNPDGSLTLLFQWKDKDKNLVSRSVIVNDGTVIGIDGQLKTMAGPTDAVLKKKAVATVGPDMVTAVNLRFGRAMVAVSKDQLTPAQLASLQAAAPAINPASDVSLNNRVDGIVASMQLNDPAKEGRLKQILATDLRPFAIRTTRDLRRINRSMKISTRGWRRN